ncbi:hypothetical protein ACFU76_17355, partial [Streptomyces sp. NPDC057539]|uniref:hypothetical protein n=1 Tax=Streptomyces sp. NPDC057539 TaxID=3346159 RepID=UPI0036C0AC1D
MQQLFDVRPRCWASSPKVSCSCCPATARSAVVRRMYSYGGNTQDGRMGADRCPFRGGECDLGSFVG